MKIGVLAVQGDFAAHARALSRLGVEAIEVRRADEIERIDGLIIPGGESTTMLKFLSEENLSPAIKQFAESGRPLFGTCAGAILLAREAINPAQPSLNLIDISVERNAFGRQVDSFIGYVETTLEGGRMEAVFIRAPRIRRVGHRVEVLAALDGEPVLVRERNILAATFHPEMTEDGRAHSLFLNLTNQECELIAGQSVHKR
ncbi:MAG TPA: pyridoxal 5'-phosphate synthase glutaminase subunit PdxT [Blastocatellia bacterium]